MTDSTGLKGLRIMIAEDEALVAMDLVDLVEHSGGEVYGPCSSVTACLASLENSTPDAAILDVRLGSEEVFEVAILLAERDVPIVFHSGHARPSSTADRFPNSAWLEKPSDQAELSAVLQRALK